jgi:shikimate dehydrogenase
VIAPLLAGKAGVPVHRQSQRRQGGAGWPEFSDIAAGQSAGSFADLAGKSFDLVINATSASLSGASLPLPPGIFAPGCAGL